MNWVAEAVAIVGVLTFIAGASWRGYFGVLRVSHHERRLDRVRHDLPANASTFAEPTNDGDSVYARDTSEECRGLSFAQLL